MNVSWNAGDLPIRQRGHLRLVTSEGEATADGGARARTASPSGATASPSFPRRGAQLSVEDVSDLQHLATVVDRLEAATHTLKKAIRRWDVVEAQTAARAVLHIGLRAGDFSRQMEARGRAS